MAGATKITSMQQALRQAYALMQASDKLSLDNPDEVDANLAQAAAISQFVVGRMKNLMANAPGLAMLGGGLSSMLNPGVAGNTVGAKNNSNESKPRATPDIKDVALDEVHDTSGSGWFGDEECDPNQAGDFIEELMMDDMPGTYGPAEDHRIQSQFELAGAADTAIEPATGFWGFSQNAKDAPRQSSNDTDPMISGEAAPEVAVAPNTGLAAGEAAEQPGDPNQSRSKQQASEKVVLPNSSHGGASGEAASAQSPNLAGHPVNPNEPTLGAGLAANSLAHEFHHALPAGGGVMDGHCVTSKPVHGEGNFSFSNSNADENNQKRDKNKPTLTGGLLNQIRRNSLEVARAMVALVAVHEATQAYREKGLVQNASKGRSNDRGR